MKSKHDDLQQNLPQMRAAALAKLGRDQAIDVAVGSTDELLHELQVQQIELGMQNEALRQAQVALEESRDRHADLYDFAPIGYLTVSDKGLVTEANLTASTLFGVERTDLLHHRFDQLIAPGESDRWHHRFLNLIQNVEQAKFKLILKRADGSLFHALLNGRRVAKSGQAPALRITVTDISDHVTAKRELAVYRGHLEQTVAEQKLTEQTLESTKDTLRELGAYQERAKEEERKRIAREIHDELGGLLTCIKAHMSIALVRMVRAGQPQDPELVAASALADSAIETVRRVVTDLRPSVLDQLGVWAALEWYADQFKEQEGLHCEFRIDAAAAATELDPERSTALYRIVQEAFTNVVRHSEASRVSVRVTRNKASVMVEVADNGKGIATERLLDRESFGIVGMRERALNFGGELRITGEAGKGTLVTLRMPLGVEDGG